MTNTLADRDQLIGEVIVNLNTVLGSLGGQSDQFAQGGRLAVGTGDGSGSAQDRHQQRRWPTPTPRRAASPTCWPRPARRSQKVVHETDRAAGIVVADHDYFDNLLNTLPDAYQALGRQGIYGDFFSFYLCDLVLKLNGKGGQPVYVKVAGQPTGRCAPR